MQKLKFLIGNANSKIRSADHLAYTTFPLIKDPKLIPKIAENVLEGMKLAIESVVYYDRLYKRVTPVGEEFEAKYDIFKHKCSKRYNIPGEYLLAFEDLAEIIEAHKTCPTTFVRNNSIVICSNHYQNVRTLNFEKVKNFLNIAKQFIVKANKIVN